MPSNPKVFGRGGGAGEEPTFNTFLKKSLKEGIASVVGRQTASSVEFYLDPAIATKDILSYTMALEKMFTVGAKLIEERCAEALYSFMGLEFAKHEEYKLNDYVADAKKKWLRKEIASES